jgi:hypothetical protein
MDEIYSCAECGHLHFLGRLKGYEPCPIDGCDCPGQDWAREIVVTGWDGRSKPIYRFADELGLPDSQRASAAAEYARRTR